MARVEPMEARRLLSASIELDESGTVVATGTEGHDTLRAERVGFDDVRVTVNSLSKTFDLDDVTGFRLDGLFGVDSLKAVGKIPNVTLDGGGSFDALTAGPLPTTLLNGELFFAANGRAVGEVLPDGQLAVLGVAGNDRIKLTRGLGEGPRVEVDSVFQGIFGEDEFTGYEVVGGDGNDDLQLGGLFTNPVSFFGGNGDDTYTIGEGTAARVDGGAGKDRVTVRGNGDVTESLLAFNAGDGVDTIVMDGQTGLDLNDYGGVENVENARGEVIGNDLDNHITAQPGFFFAVLRGGGGHDTLIGNSGGSSLFGGSGNDTLRGGDGSDVLNGEGGNDVIRAFGGNDFMDGGSGDDLLDGGLGADDFVGGTGTDLADYSNRTENLTVGIGSAADDGAAGEGDNVRTGVENVTAGSGNDQIRGDGVRNVLRGNGGTDTLYGLGGDDLLNGGSGADRLFGGDGNDSIYARDGVKDLVLDGGSGFDKAQKDSTDPRTSIEQLLA